MLRRVAAVLIKIVNIQWWSWALLCCVKKAAEFFQRTVSAQNTPAWKCNKLRITRCE